MLSACTQWNSHKSRASPEARESVLGHVCLVVVSDSDLVFGTSAVVLGHICLVVASDSDLVFGTFAVVANACDLVSFSFARFCAGGGLAGHKRQTMDGVLGRCVWGR